jgi:hypothetical protein
VADVDDPRRFDVLKQQGSGKKKNIEWLFSGGSPKFLSAVYLLSYPDYAFNVFHCCCPSSPGQFSPV